MLKLGGAEQKSEHRHLNFYFYDNLIIVIYILQTILNFYKINLHSTGVILICAEKLGALAPPASPLFLSLCTMYIHYDHACPYPSLPHFQKLLFCILCSWLPVWGKIACCS